MKSRLGIDDHPLPGARIDRLDQVHRVGHEREDHDVMRQRVGAGGDRARQIAREGATCLERNETVDQHDFHRSRRSVNHVRVLIGESAAHFAIEQRGVVGVVSQLADEKPGVAEAPGLRLCEHGTEGAEIGADHRLTSVRSASHRHGVVSERSGRHGIGSGRLFAKELGLNHLEICAAYGAEAQMNGLALFRPRGGREHSEAEVRETSSRRLVRIRRAELLDRLERTPQNLARATAFAILAVMVIL